MKFKPDEPLLTVTELAAWLRKDRVTVYKSAKRGLIPGRIKLGGSVRFKESAIREWIENRGIKSGK